MYYVVNYVVNVLYMYYVVNLATHGWCRQSLGGMCVCVRACVRVCAHTRTQYNILVMVSKIGLDAVCVCVCACVCVHTHTHIHSTTFW